MDKKASNSLATLLVIPALDVYYKNQHAKWQANYDAVQQDLEPLINELRVLHWEFDNATGHRLRYQIVLRDEVTLELKEWDSIYAATKFNLQEVLTCPKYTALVQQEQVLQSQEPFHNGVPATYSLLAGLFVGYIHAKFLAKK